jgi:AmmeMemoRadiSam system protein B
MTDKTPLIRRDIEFFPVQHGGQQLILIRDDLGLVQEGKGVAPNLYQFMSLLDGTRTIRDLQMELMRQRGGVLVDSDEVKRLLSKLDESGLLDSDRFRTARDKIMASFTSSEVRPCFHCGRTYPDNPAELKKRLDEVLASQPQGPEPEGKIEALVSPHIDLATGHKVYASAYQMLKRASPSRVVLLGIGHHMMNDLFCVTDKDFETPLGMTKNEPALTKELREAGQSIVAANDFAHRSEHSIEFQVIFLQHLFATNTFTIVPILCGSLQLALPEYSRNAYLKKAGPFLEKLREITKESDKETLVVAGVDFSHIGPKFGHEVPAGHLESQSTAHDKTLLKHLCQLDADDFWEESIKSEDRFNVCGFSAMACLLEILPQCKGKILDYQIRHEEATRSAVSFSAVVFASPR